MSGERQNRLGDYIRRMARPWPLGDAGPEAKALPTLSEIARASGLGVRRLDHKLAGRAKWTKVEVLAVCKAIDGSPTVMLALWRDDGPAKGPPGNPAGWRHVHEKYAARTTEDLRLTSAKRRRDHLEMTKAQNALNRAIRRGQLAPEPCQLCGLEPLKLNGRQRIEAHHHLGYDEEHWLKVQWLCGSCHAKAHSGHPHPKREKSLDMANQP